MKNQNALYTQWLEHRRQVKIPETFAKNVMTGIERRNRAMQWEWGRIFRRFGLHHPLAQWSTGLGLVLIGLFRIIYVTTGLLRTNLLMP